ncbi:Uncharacterised protein [uncultured archaeon]|nr:Uncharacterised protein [uncultured archaeon]
MTCIRMGIGPGGRIAIAIILAALLLFHCAFADVKVEGWISQNCKYIISNINDYPDYVFLTSSDIWGWEQASLIDKNGTFGGGYKLDSFIVHAARAQDFDRERFFRHRDESSPGYVNCTDYCMDNPKIVSSNITLDKAISINEILPLEKIECYLKIDNITSQRLNLSRTRMLYYYENGSTQEMPVENAS